MAKKIASKIVKETAKKTAKKFKPNPNSTKNFGSGAPEKGTVGARKTPKAKATPAKRGRPKGSTNKTTGVTAQRKSARATKAKGTAPVPTKVPTAVQAAAAAPAAGLTALAVTSNRKPSSKAAEVSFGDAFKAARKKGEGTKFTYKGKQYSAVTKDDLKRKGYDANELRQYMNRKGKARGPLNRLGQGVKKVLLGKDKKFGGDKGAIDFIRTRKKKPTTKKAGGMVKSKGMRKGGSVKSKGMRRGGTVKSKGMRNGGMMKSKGMRNGGMMKSKGMRRGGSVKSKGMRSGGRNKAVGIAKRGFGKAYINSKR